VGWSRVRLPRPTGIRNGGLLLVLVALAAVVALVDEPPELGDGRPLPSIFQTLPPTGITALPPAGAQPPPATHSGDARPATATRAHPNRQHPRPAEASAPLRGDIETRAARDQGGSGPGGPAAGGSGPSGGSPPPVTTPLDDAAAAGVRVPPVAVRVRPPALLGRDLPEVRVATPEVKLDTALP
jgi:hypothetical protein